MKTSLKASPKGLQIIDRARRMRGWNKDAHAWIDAANELLRDTGGSISRSTLQRFWQGQLIRQENFFAICKAVGIDNWEEIVESFPNSKIFSYVLHLSDLHFGTTDNARIWYAQLAEDLRYELNCSRLDALILSGDIASRSTPEEYAAAQLFMSRLCQEFQLRSQQIILVPGNHDINWELAQEAYTLINRKDYNGELIQGYYIEESASIIKIRDEEKYKQRFTHFSQFYYEIKGEDYSLEYDQQYSLQHLPEQNLLILGLNSAWQIDHYYKSRASIHPDALSNVLSQIRRSSAYENCLKIAVWHHPLNSAFENRIKDGSFIERLAVAGFRLVLHGGIHRAESSSYRYDYRTDGRQINIIGAGVFGIPTQKLIPGSRWQYNLLKLESSQITVETRRRNDPNGAWKPDSRWLQSSGKPPVPYYEIKLDELFLQGSFSSSTTIDELNDVDIGVFNRDLTTNPEEEFAQAFINLTPRQQEVLLRFLAGEKDVEIAANLYVTSATVKKHIANICKHFGVTRRHELIALFAKYKPDLFNGSTPCPKIVLSYYGVTEPEKQLITQLETAFQTLGYEVFIASGTLRMEKNGLQKIYTALNQCDYLVLLLSTLAAGSEMVTEEVRLAQTRRDDSPETKPVILPILVNCPLSLINQDLLGYLQGISYYEWHSPDDTNRLVQTLLEFFSSSRSKLQPFQAPPSPDPLQANSPHPPIVEPELLKRQEELTSAFYVTQLGTLPEATLVGGEIEFSIHLKQFGTEDRKNYVLEVPYSEAVGGELNIILNAPGFQLDGDNTASLLLDPNIDWTTQIARFQLTALRPGSTTITAELYRGDIFQTNIEAKVQVTGFDETSFSRTRITTQPRPVPQPDFILRVQTAWNETNSACKFHYQLRSFRLPSLFSGETNYHSQLLSSSWIEQMQGLLGTTLENISDALPEDGRSHLTSLGQYLFQYLLPPELQTDFRSLIPRDRTFTLLILADQDASLPWELLHDGQRFLSDRFIIGRWFWELNNTRPHEFPVGAINVAHYADVEQPQLWTDLLEPPGSPPPLPLPEGVLGNLDSTEAMRGLHLIRYSQSSDATNRRNAPVTLDDTNNAQDIERQMRPAKLNVRRNRPLVSLGYVRRDRPELTTLEQTWASAFIRAGCSAFTGSLWAVDPAVEAAFISGFYNRLWTGDSLGEAFHASRQLARTVAPDSLDWLAYVLFGDPMARPYRPVEGKGYAVVEPIGREIDEPLPPGVSVRFRLSLRRTPPVWHEERVIEVAENLTFENLQAHVKTFGLQVTPDSPIAMSLAPTGNYLGWFTLVAPPEMAGNSALVQVFLMDGMLPIHSLMFSLNIENEGGD